MATRKRPTKRPTNRSTKHSTSPKKTTGTKKATRGKPVKKAPAKTGRAAPKTTKKATKKTAKPAARKAPAKKANARKTTARKGTARRKTPEQQVAGPGSTIQPMLVVPDVEAEMRFLEAIGFQTMLKMPGPDGGLMHVILSMGDAMVHLNPRMDPEMLAQMPGLEPGLVERARQVHKGPLGLGMSLYVVVPDVNKVNETLERMGTPIVESLRDQFWGDRTVMFTDPAGYVWSCAQHIRDVTPDEMAKAMEQMAAAPTQ